jgi:hypothetical protein
MTGLWTSASRKEKCLPVALERSRGTFFRFLPNIMRILAMIAVLASTTTVNLGVSFLCKLGVKVATVAVVLGQMFSLTLLFVLIPVVLGPSITRFSTSSASTCSVSQRYPSPTQSPEKAFTQLATVAALQFLQLRG